MTSCLGQRRLDNAIISKTQQGHHAMANVVSAALSPAWLGNDITPQPTLSRQRHHQHDSVATSRHGQCRLGNATTSKTRQQHHAMTNVTSPAPLPTFARQHHREHDSGAWCTLFWTSNLTRRVSADDALGLEGCHSNLQQDSSTLLTTLPILNRGGCVIIKKIMGHFNQSAKLYW
jgi:hypothetical protein